MDAGASWLELAPFLAGWTIGWLLLWRTRPLPAASDRGARQRSVIVPARDEEASIGTLIASVTPTLDTGDELIVVDDHSRDATARIAADLGARVVSPPPPGPGWLGKPNACWRGRQAAHGDLLVFLDADVRAGPDLLDGLDAATRRAPDAIVSVQPWHTPGSAVEQLSLFCNVTALMASGVGAVGRWRHRVAFGPVVAMSAELYDRTGGHAHPEVRGQSVEDVALARQVGSIELYTGRPSASFRMYPGGFGELLDGWTRSLAGGATATSPILGLATAAWVWAVAAAPFLGWLATVLAVLQVAALGRRAGRFSPLMALAYPVALAVFVVVVMRSGWRFVGRRDVTWKGRDVPARS